ncbi:MAG: hydrogenase subunit MbhD domain-containing protein [Candidatus Thermoplasmatota archaeon]
MTLDIEGTGSAVVLLMIVLFVVLAIELRDLVKAAIALGIASALLGGVFYVMEAPFAAVFELSVAAGLITVLLLSAIGMTEKTEGER